MRTRQLSQSARHDGPVRDRPQCHRHRPEQDRDLPGCNPAAYRPRPHQRICQHHARMQQLLPLLHRALHPRARALTRCRQHPARGGRPARPGLPRGDAAWPECQFLWTLARRQARGGLHILRPAAAACGALGARYARALYHLQPRGYDRRHTLRHCRGAQSLPPHTLPGTERLQQDTPSDEPQVHPRGLSGAHSRHTTHHTRLRHIYRPLCGLPRRDRGRP